MAKMAKKTAATAEPRAFDPSGPAQAGSGIYGISTSAEQSLVHLIPVPFEATTSYRGGTSAAPQAILEASYQVDLYDVDTGRPYEHGIYLWPESPEIHRLNARAKRAAQTVIKAATGGRAPAGLARALKTVDEACARVNAIVREIAARALDAGKLTGLVGGDHSTPFGLIEAVAARHPGVGVLHFDAHHDLRDAYEGFAWSHASIMHNVATRIPGVAKLVQVGIRDFSEEEAQMVKTSGGRIVAFYDRDIALARFAGEPFTKTAKAIAESLPDEVHVSFDIDGLDPRYCPRTGTPVPGGLDIQEAYHILREVVASGRRIVGFDLNEVTPGPDEWDANVGARVLYKLIGFALRSRGHGEVTSELLSEA
jgi:agmatinase